MEAQLVEFRNSLHRLRFALRRLVPASALRHLHWHRRNDIGILPEKLKSFNHINAIVIIIRTPFRNGGFKWNIQPDKPNFCVSMNRA